MTYLVQTTGSFAPADAHVTHPPEAGTMTYRLSAPTPRAARIAATQLLISQQAAVGLAPTGPIHTEIAGG